MLRNVAREAKAELGEPVLRCVDYMDDGSPIALRVEINEEEGTAHFDFSGSGPQVWLWLGEN